MQEQLGRQNGHYPVQCVDNAIHAKIITFARIGFMVLTKGSELRGVFRIRL